MKNRQLPKLFMVQSKLLTKYTNLIHFFGDKDSKFKLRNFITLEQVHGNKVAIIKDNSRKSFKGLDGLATNRKLALAIRTADCLPVFFYDPKDRIISAVHAGWKGLLHGIIRNAILSMKKLGSKPEDLIVSVGPHIQACCYNVPEERIHMFSPVNDFGEFRSNSWYLNLSKVALLQLKSFGIADSNIDISDICTSCDEKFWSFRRDKIKAGRMLNIIGMR